MNIRTKTAHQGRVEEFMVKAKQTIPDRPTIPDAKTRELRAKLIIEEALETIHELGVIIEVNGHDLTNKEEFRKVVVIESDGEPNLEGIADGCADIIVVTTGTLSACGIADDSVQREVDCNNLAKFEHRCPKCHQTDQITHNLNKGNGWVFCTACNTEWQSGYHNEAGKWVKPSTHKPPRIAEVLAEQTRFAERQVQELLEANARVKRQKSGKCFGEDYYPSDKTCQACLKRTKCVTAYCGG